MNKWTEKHLLGLRDNNRIRGFNIPQRQKNYSGNQHINIPREKPKGLVWLEWNLLYWGNERALQLEREHQFDQQRKWRFDFAFPAIKIAVEYEGGIFMDRSGHNSHTGIQRDIEKYNRAQALGWKIVRCTAKDYTTVPKSLNDLVK